MSTDFDAIVVGSGITGGWAAKELTEKRLKVLILERGKPQAHQQYATEHMAPWNIPLRNRPPRELYKTDYAIQSRGGEFDETSRHLWNNDRENPYVQAEGKPYNWMQSGVVGGRSLLWGRQVYRWSDLDFEANRRDGHGNDWPIRYRDIAPWYSYVEKFIGVSGQAENLPQLPDSEFLPPMAMFDVEKRFKERVEAKFTNRRVTIGRVAVLTQPHNGRGPCHYCGPCYRGCSAGAYFSSQSSTLPAATATGNLTLLPEHIVERLDYDAATKRISGVKVINAATGERKTFTSKLVFLCASTNATLRVLLNSTSSAFPNGLANRSGVLGRYVMDHHFQAGARGVMPAAPGQYYVGNRPNGIYIPRFRNLNGQDEDADFVRGYGCGGRTSVEEWNTLWAKTPGFGVEFKNALRQPGNWVLMVGAFGECLPYEDNRVVLDRKTDRFGMPLLRFEVTFRENELRMRRDAVANAAAMLAAAGATQITPFHSDPVPGNAIHELGGARMGNDPAESVLNRYNQAHDVSNLFVTDGSCMASSSCVNPSLTYMAITARAVDYAITHLRAG